MIACLSDLNQVGHNYTVLFIAPILCIEHNCVNFKVIRYESTSSNRIVADKLHCVIIIVHELRSNKFDLVAPLVQQRKIANLM